LSIVEPIGSTAGTMATSTPAIFDARAASSRSPVFRPPSASAPRGGLGGIAGDVLGDAEGAVGITVTGLR
jgi:hypothetical protein